ncbi:hypothetical protein PINS_up013845 [Pythium insidiosum]|nr:hypothetical protein PINS_up013845 [Pythium insidiosum]
MDASFRTRLKAFSQICRALKGVVEIAKHNLKRVSVEVTGQMRGTVRKAVAARRHHKKQTRKKIMKTKDRHENDRDDDDDDDDDVLLSATLADFAMEVLLDVDALVEQHRMRSISSATEMTGAVVTVGDLRAAGGTRDQARQAHGAEHRGALAHGAVGRRRARSRRSCRADSVANIATRRALRQDPLGLQRPHGAACASQVGDVPHARDAADARADRPPAAAFSGVVPRASSAV